MERACHLEANLLVFSLVSECCRHADQCDETKSIEEQLCVSARFESPASLSNAINFQGQHLVNVPCAFASYNCLPR